MLKIFHEEKFYPWRAPRKTFIHLFAIRLSTTVGSAKVETSPIWSVSPVAILRKILRIIFPERVLGRAGAQCIASGVAIGPITERTCFFNSPSILRCTRLQRLELHKHRCPLLLHHEEIRPRQLRQHCHEQPVHFLPPQFPYDARKH